VNLSFLDLPPGPRRTAELAAWLQGIERAQGLDVPALVGGSAVEVYTAGAYVSGDLDFVGNPSPALRRALLEVGFERAGRHWVHSSRHVFIEFPSDALDAQLAVELEVGELRLRVLAPEDLLVGRLAAFQFWQSEVDFENARLLVERIGDDLDRKRLRRRAREAGVADSLRRLLEEVESS
jgi:hypothetical protein